MGGNVIHSASNLYQEKHFAVGGVGGFLLFVLCFLGCVVVFFSFCTIGNVSYKQTFTRTTCVQDILSPHIALKSLNWPHVSSVLSWLWKLWRDFKSVLLHWYVTISVSQQFFLSSLYTYAHASQMVLDLGAIQSSALERPGYVSYFRSQEELPVLLFW